MYFFYLYKNLLKKLYKTAFSILLVFLHKLINLIINKIKSINYFNKYHYKIKIIYI
jgi:hypothetical protein